ncbi:Tyrosine recombinase XerD [archaeon HR03]|nr:Tyrosine recombinase XerD [archaeon HR03]
MVGAGPSHEEDVSRDLGVLDVWEGFLSAKTGTTAENYRAAMRRFVTTCGFSDLVDAAMRAEEKDLVLFIRHLRDEGLAPQSIRLHYQAVKSFLSLYARPINWSRVENLLPKKRNVRFNEAVPRDVVEAVLENMDNSTKRLAIWLIWATGLRIGEALSLRARDIDFTIDPPKLTVISEKTHEPREVPLPTDIAEALKQHLQRLQPGDFIFHPRGNPSKPLARTKLRAAFRSALIKANRAERDKSGIGWRYTIHGLRRSYETNLVRAGVNSMVVGLLLGHRIGIEQHYLRLTYDDIVKEWRKAENLLTLKQPIPTNIEERLHALEEAVKLYEKIFAKLEEKFPNFMRLLDLE